jgi:hypothetical protein
MNRSGRRLRSVASLHIDVTGPDLAALAGRRSGDGEPLDS